MLDISSLGVIINGIGSFVLCFSGIFFSSFLAHALELPDFPAHLKPGGSDELSKAVDNAILKHRKRIKKQQEEFDKWREERSEQFKNSFLDGHSIEVYTDGKKLLKERLKSIYRAKRSIYLSTFIFGTDSSAIKIAKALCYQSKRGIDVRMMIDSYGAKKFYRRYSERLRSSCGIGVLKFNPPAWGIEKVPYVMHEKLLIIDGETLHMGGNGISNKYHHIQPASKFFHDIDVKIQGSAACWYHNKFIEIYRKSILRDDPGGDFLTGRENQRRSSEFESLLFGPKKFESCGDSKFGETSIFPLYANPLFEKKRPIFRAYINAFLASQDNSEINIYSPYFVPHDKYIAAMLWARAHGMKVTVITNSIKSNDEGVLTLVGMVYRVGQLIKNGVQIRLWQGAKTLHRKSGIYGNQYAFVGSDNQDIRGHRYSSESVVFSNHPDFVARINQEFKEDLKNTIPLTKKYIKKILSKTGRVKKWLIRKWLWKYL